MANTQSAKKRIRQNEKRRIRNKAIRTRARTAIREARSTIEAGDLEDAVLSVQTAIKELDRASAKGVIHQKNAARRKSRLMKQLAVLQDS